MTGLSCHADPDRIVYRNKSSFYTCVDSDANYDASIKGRQHSARNFLLILESALKPLISYMHTVYTILPI